VIRLSDRARDAAIVVCAVAIVILLAGVLWFARDMWAGVFEVLRQSEER
jgi:FtsZ-interacting cell division protein ZipA